MIDLARVLEDLDRAIAESAPEDAPALALALSARLAGLAARGMNGNAPEQVRATGEDLLSVGEAAGVLKVPPDWIYRRSRTLPFTVRLGARGLRVSRLKMETWIRSRKAGAS